MKHICLNKYFLLFLLIIILTGNFNAFFPYFSLLVIHEMGHALVGIILGYKLDKITFYPYGGITTFNLPLNIPLKEELMILLAGPIMQIIGYFILNPFYDIKLYHYTLLIFNLLPIYPLDGGKILNILCNYSFNYLKSFSLTFIISFLFLIGLIIYNFIFFNFNMLLMIAVLLTKLIKIYQKRWYYYNKFLLERYLHHFHFRKVKSISNIKKFYRDTKHFIQEQDEEKVLKKIFE